MRDRLIDLLKQIYFEYSEECFEACESDGYGIAPLLEEFFADNLLANCIIVPPVRVGQWVYVLSRGKIVPMMVCSILIGTFENYIKVEAEEEYGYWRLDIPFHNSTIDWYLTREEAEKALKETHNE